MKGLIFTMLVLSSFSVFAVSTGQDVVYADGADCGERTIQETTIQSTNSAVKSTGSTKQ